MPKRNFVREIKPENIKDINPYDIIYLALKDGSIVLISDSDEETLDYDDIKSETLGYSQKRANANFYTSKYGKNKKQTKTISSNLTNDTDNNKNNKNKYSNYTKDKDKRKTPSTPSYSFENNRNKPVIISNRNKNENINNYRRNNNNNDRDKMNKSYTEFNKTNPNFNYHRRTERLEKSFDNFNSDSQNNYFHKIEYISNNYNERPKSIRYQTEQNNRNTNSFHQRINIIQNDYSNRTPQRRENKRFIYDNTKNNYRHLINISDKKRNINEGNDNSFMNRTQQFERRDIYQDYSNRNNNINNNNKNINSFNRGQPIKPARSQSFSNTNRNIKTPQTLVIKRREMEIMGRIVNDDDSYRLVDHKHPNTLFEPKCPYCQNLAKKNKLCISNIKEESIYDNHSFVAIFGSGSKKGRSHSNTGSNFYKIP